MAHLVLAFGSKSKFVYDIDFTTAKSARVMPLPREKWKEFPHLLTVEQPALITYEGEKDTATVAWLQSRLQSADKKPDALLISTGKNRPPMPIPATAGTVVWGGTSSGKTWFGAYLTEELRAISDSPRPDKGVFFIQHREPTPLDPWGNFPTQTREEFANKLADALFDDTIHAITVDAMRDFVYSASEGGTGAGGMNMGLFITITQLSVIAGQCGKALIMLLNPMMKKEELIAEYADILAGTTFGVIHIPQKGRFEVQSRSPKSGRSTLIFNIAEDTMRNRIAHTRLVARSHRDPERTSGETPDVLRSRGDRLPFTIRARS